MTSQHEKQCCAESLLAFIAIASSRVVWKIWSGVQQVEPAICIKGQDTCAIQDKL